MFVPYGKQNEAPWLAPRAREYGGDVSGDPKDLLQLPAQTPPKYRMHVSTNEITNDIRVPYGRDEQLGFFEPVCRDHPSGGAGGGTQTLINQPHTALEVWDISGRHH